MSTDHLSNEHLSDAASTRGTINRRQLLGVVTAGALTGSGLSHAQSAAASDRGVHDLDLSSAATAIRTGAMTSESYVTQLLDRASNLSDLKAFITIDRDGALEAARAADKARAAGRSAPLLGLPIGVKDSYLTKGLASTVGTAVLKNFTPNRDAAVVAAVKDAGGIVFGKNNLAEMSYGLTGINDHYGQARNPHNLDHITGGSSSGAGASVAARIVPAALGGDTVGSIRVPASLCGVVGFKPTPGRWPSKGVAPISGTLDTTGVLARSVADCMLLDTTVTRSASPSLKTSVGLKGVRLAYAPRQHLAGVDPAVEATFRESLRKLTDAGAVVVEIELDRTSMHSPNASHGPSSRRRCLRFASSSRLTAFPHRSNRSTKEWARASRKPGLSSSCQAHPTSFRGGLQDGDEQVSTRPAAPLQRQSLHPCGCTSFSDDTMRSAKDRQPMEIRRRG